MTGVALPDDWLRIEPAHPLDCVCWLLRTGGESIRFDAGTGLGPMPVPVPGWLFLTHGHADHSGGAARLLASGTRVVTGRLTADWLARGDEAAISLDRARAAGVYPADYRLMALARTGTIAPGERRRIGAAVIEAFATPGHSADHLSFLVETAGARVLVGGDVLFDGGTVVLQDARDSTLPETCRSIELIAGLAPDHILPGHGPALIGAGAARAIDAAAARVARFLPPLPYL